MTIGCDSYNRVNYVGKESPVEKRYQWMEEENSLRSKREVSEAENSEQSRAGEDLLKISSIDKLNARFTCYKRPLRG